MESQSEIAGSVVDPSGNRVVLLERIWLRKIRRADYDAEHDILFLGVSEPEPAEAEDTPEGHAIHYAPGTHRIVGLTIFSPRRILERDGVLTVTFPEMVETRSAEDMAELLVAA